MSEVKWTQAQKDAIDARGGPLLVSAAAGSGKTTVLVERIIELITDKDNPASADKFLVVTFTRAAAAEMKQRIAKRLELLISEDPSNELLIEQQLKLGQAQISTIDSFCSTLAREYFHLLDISPDFRIGDDSELDLMRTAALTTVFDKLYASDDDKFLQLVDIYSSANEDDKLKGIILNLYNFLRAQPFPQRWIKEKLKLLDAPGDTAKTIWGEQLIGDALMTFEYIQKQLDAAYKEAEEAPVYLQALDKDAQVIDALGSAFQSGVWDDICNVLSEVDFEPLPKSRATSDEEKEAKARCKAIRDNYKKYFGSLKVYFSRTSDDFVREIESIKPITHGLFRLVMMYDEEYSRIKKERSVADYNDLEHWALQLLVRDGENGVEITDTARELSQRYDYVMVDEYQDVNTVQDTIFNAISDGDRKLFVVGDVKQSIYRFRQSMPEIFIARKDTCTLYDRTATAYPAKIILDANFRSRKEITDCVNFLFSKVMTKEAGEIDYNEEEALTAKADYPEKDGAAVSLHIVGTGGSSSDDRIEIEARYTAGLIRKMMSEEKITDKTGTRAPDFGDFCVLMRDTSNRSEVYVREFIRLGIPAYCEKGESFFEQPEIRIMMSLLRVIDNPARDIPMAAVLMSPLFNFTADDIGALRSEGRRVPLYELLLAHRDENEKAAYFLDVFGQLRSCSGNVTSDELISRIYSLTLFPEIVLSGEDGEFRQRNLRLLLQYARKYESSGFKGISGFVLFLDKLAESNKDLGAAQRRDGSSENAVKIMTIHKSKGLEFPICIVTSLGKAFNKGEAKEMILLHNKLGVGAKIINERYMCSYKGITRMAVDSAINNSRISEELRLLYVAMTRAKERLVLVAAVSDENKVLADEAKNLVCDGNRVSPFSVLSSKNYFDIIIRGLMLGSSGKPLREAAGYDGYVDNNDGSLWDIVITSCVPEEEEEREHDERKPATPKHADEKLTARQLSIIKEKLSRRYAFEQECTVPVKVAASSLAEHELGLEYAAQSKPAFMSDGGLTAAERGTALHTFAQHCDFENARFSIKDEKQRLVDGGYLTEQQAKSINEKRVGRFLESRLLDEMLDADMLEREYRFTVELPAKLAGIEGSDENVIMQGAIDCLFELDGELTIVDYKTDRVKDPDELSRRYAPQLRLYKYAVSKIFGKEPTRCVLYSFSLGEEIEVDVDVEDDDVN